MMQGWQRCGFGTVVVASECIQPKTYFDISTGIINLIEMAEIDIGRA